MTGSIGTFPQRSMERLKAAPYGPKRERVTREILDQLAEKPEMATIVAAARDWGVDQDDFALQQLLKELDQGERELRKLALSCTPLLAEPEVKRRQLESFSKLAPCRLAAELWDACSSKSLRQTIHMQALISEPEDSPLWVFSSLRSSLRFTPAAEKEAMARAVYGALDRDPNHQWVTDSLRQWGLPRDYATLDKASQIRSEDGPGQLALKVTDPKDFATQLRQLKSNPVAMALHQAVAEPKKSQVWSAALTRPEEFLRSYMGYHYSAGKQEDAAVYQAVWPSLRDTPVGQLADHWGLTGIETVKYAATHPEAADRWGTAMAITREADVGPMRAQLAELPGPMGELVRQIEPHLEDDQVHQVWDYAVRLRRSDEEESRATLLMAVRMVAPDENQALPLVQVFWRDCERTSEQVALVESLSGLTRGEGLRFVLDKLIARPVMSEKLRARLVELRDQGGEASQLRPLLAELKKEAAEEDAMRKMMGEKRDPTSGIKEGETEVEVGGIRLPKRRASPT